jgi:hypothetical protein
MEGRILGGRPVGRPRRRWIDDVHQDAREQLGVRRWRREAEDRKSWRRLIEEARVRFGLQCHRRERETTTAFAFIQNKICTFYHLHNAMIVSVNK